MKQNIALNDVNQPGRADATCSFLFMCSDTESLDVHTYIKVTGEAKSVKRNH